MGEIAERAGAPQAFTAKLLRDLARASLMRSARGAGGGFEMPREMAKQVNLRMIMEAIGDDSYSSGCAMGLPACDATHPCSLHDHFAGLRGRIRQVLENTDVDSLVEDLENGNTRVKI